SRRFTRVMIHAGVIRRRGTHPGSSACPFVRSRVMIGPMKQRILARLLTIAFAIAIPIIAFASSDDEGGDGIDARLKGYKDGGTVALKDASGTALTWLLLVVLAGLCIGVLFMNAKRTHLD